MPRTPGSESLVNHVLSDAEPETLRVTVDPSAPMAMRSFIATVDPATALTTVTEFDDFSSLSKALPEALASDGSPAARGPLRARDTFRGLESALRAGDQKGLAVTPVTEFDVSSSSAPAPRLFTWINVFNCAASEVSRLGSLCGLHPLTVEDIGADHHEKCELFLSLRYVHCVIEAEEANERVVPVHVILSDRWVLTLHEDDCSAVGETRRRLDDECHAARRALAKGQLSNGPRSPSWVLYSLLDAVVESMVPECEKLVAQAMEIDRRVFETPGESEDVLRRLSARRARVYALKQRVFARQRLLAGVLSPSVEFFVPVGVKVYLRDLCDHVTWCDTRLNFADQVLSLANSNSLACMGIEAGRIAFNTNSLMRKLTAAVFIFTPWMVMVSLFGTDINVPFQTDPSTTPFWGLNLGFGIPSFIVYFIYHVWDERLKKQHRW